MGSDIRRYKNIGTADATDRNKRFRVSPKDALFDHDWEELVIRFDSSRQSFEVKTAGGSESGSANAEFRRKAASDGKK